MAHAWRAALATGIMGIGVACGGSSRQEEAAQQFSKGAEQMKAAAEQTQGSAEQIAKGFESMAKGLSVMAGGDPNAKPVDPISFRELMSVFPEHLSGWERSKPTGERMSSPVNFSQAGVEFTKGDARLDLKITDSALNQMLIAPIAMMLTSGYEKETANGYEKSTKVGGFPGWEKWNGAGKNGELTAIVNQRFIVQVEGRNIDDPKVMHDLIAATGLNKLAELQ